MKKYLISFLLGTSTLLCASTQLSPLHEEDPHFIHYRALMIDGAVHEIDMIVNDLIEEGRLKDYEQRIFTRLLDTIRFNLGNKVLNDEGE